MKTNKTKKSSFLIALVGKCFLQSDGFYEYASIMTRMKVYDYATYCMGRKDDITMR